MTLYNAIQVILSTPEPDRTNIIDNLSHYTEYEKQLEIADYRRAVMLEKLTAISDSYDNEE